MKNFFIMVAVGFLLSMTACQKSNFEHKGKIHGLDPALCSCCGGYILEIDDAPEGRYLFDNLDESANSINLDAEKFDNGPIEVRFNYHLNIECGIISRIIIDDIEEL